MAGGAGARMEQWKRKLSVISPGEGPGCSPKCQRKNCMWMWWEQGVPSSERDQPGSTPASALPSLSQGICTTLLFSPHRSLGASPVSSHLHLFDPPGIENSNLAGITEAQRCLVAWPRSHSESKLRWGHGYELCTLSQS